MYEELAEALGNLMSSCKNRVGVPLTQDSPCGAPQEMRKESLGPRPLGGVGSGTERLDSTQQK